jgi:hypothetical protein
MRPGARVRGRGPELAAAAFGLLWFVALGGWRAIPPTALDWLGGGDRTQHVLGWLFFRSSRWTLPLGRIDGLAWPSGTTVGFTDSNPLVAIAAKLVAPALPRDFQYVGLWLAACFALQGFVGARLAALGSASAAYRFLGGALFVLAPVLLLRLPHDTLCAHFALLALLALHLRLTPDAAGARRALRTAAAITLLVAAVHPYLGLMALALTFALVVRTWRADRLLAARAALRWMSGLAVAVAAVFLLLGYFTAAPSHGPNFGRFSADLLALVNPLGVSSFLPALAVQPGQVEGYGYLGLGVLLLAGVTAALAVARWRPARERRAALAPVAAACLLMALYALSNEIRLAGRTVLDLRAVYRPLAGVVGPFRSSGRFLWPLVYLVTAGAVVGLPRLLGRRAALAAALLAAAVALQLADLAPRARGAYFADRPWQLRDPRWSLLHGSYDHLALAPPEVVGVLTACRGLVYDDDDYYAPFALEAYRQGLTVNSGYLARGAVDRLEPPCLEQERELARGELRARTVYVVHPSKEPLFRRAGATCGRLDRALVCVAPGQTDAFARALSR